MFPAAFFEIGTGKPDKLNASDRLLGVAGSDRASRRDMSDFRSDLDSECVRSQGDASSSSSGRKERAPRSGTRRRRARQAFSLSRSPPAQWVIDLTRAAHCVFLQSRISLGRIRTDSRSNVIVPDRRGAVLYTHLVVENWRRRESLSSIE